MPSVPGSRAVTIKFMIPNSRMGSVIGKQGSKIKEIQDASGARLNASEGMLPGSTEVGLPLFPLSSTHPHPPPSTFTLSSACSASQVSLMRSISLPTTSATSSSKLKNACRPPDPPCPPTVPPTVPPAHPTSAPPTFLATRIPMFRPRLLPRVTRRHRSRRSRYTFRTI